MTSPAYQGASLGLPRSGPGAVAPLGRRVLAVLLDWSLCQLIAAGLLGMQWGRVSGPEAFLPLAVFLVENLVLVATVGTTVGHRLLGLRVVSVDGDGHQVPPPGRSAARAVLLALFVPAIVMDADGRGLHDRAARSVVVRTH